MTPQQYSAAHKALSDELNGASKAFDDARKAEINAITNGDDHGEIAELRRKTDSAEQERDDARKALARLEKANPALERPGHTDEKHERAENVVNATVEVAHVTEIVAAAAVRVAQGYLPSPPLIDPATKLEVAIPHGGVKDNLVVGAKLLWDDVKEVGKDVRDTIANAIATGKELPGKVADTIAQALPDPARVALGGEKLPTLEAKSEPSRIEPDAAKALDNSGAARQDLSQYLSDLHTGIANGSNYFDAEKAASEKLHQNLTGKPYDMPDGLHDAVGKELEAKYGEPAKKIYQETLAANLEAEFKQTVEREGWAR